MAAVGLARLFREAASAEVRAKALYAASALQRSHALGRRQFELAGGVHALVGERWPPMWLSS